MFNQPCICSRQTVRQLIVLALVFSCLFTPLTGIQRSFAVQQDPVAGAKAAINKAEGAFRTAFDRAAKAEALLAELQETIHGTTPDETAVRNIDRLTRIVGQMFNEAEEPKTLPNQLTASQQNLTDALKELNTAKGKLDQAPADTPNLAPTKTRINSSIASFEAATERLDLAARATQLNDALNAVYPAVANVATAANERLQSLQTATDETDLFAAFQRVSQLPELMQFDLQLQERWPKLAKGLENVAKDHKANVPQTAKAVEDLHTSVKTLAANIDEKLTVLAKFTDMRIGDLESSEKRFTSEPQQQEKAAIKDIQESRRVADVLSRIGRSADSIAELAKSAGIAEFDEEKTKKAQEKLIANLAALRAQATKYHDLLSGDRSFWVTEKIRLYYFTDIPRLIKTLNPDADLMGGDADARRRAKARLEALRAAEDAQSEASGKVASLKRRVKIISEQLEEANAQLTLANQLAKETARVDADLNHRPAGSVTDEQKRLSGQGKDKAEQDRAAAQERADKLNDETNGLVAQQRAAEAELEIAQAAFERASNATLRAAQAESTAFAEARDSAPFWFAPASAASNDPAKRVEITSSTNGENAIFVRGRREDVLKVEDIVAKLDEPAPQARMTLWKIELNSDATEKGAEKFNKALEIVETEIATTRAKIADALALLLRSVSEEAERAAAKKQADDAKLAKDNPADFEERRRKDCHEKDMYAKYFAFTANQNNTVAAGTNGHSNGTNGSSNGANGSSNGTTTNGNNTANNPKFVTTASTDITGRYQRLARYALYSPQVRKELGIEFIDELGFDNPKQFGLKDPGSATTLNEALIVMLLTNPFHRAQILDRFKAGLAEIKPDPEDKDPKPVEFKRLKSMMTDTSFAVNQDAQTTRQQQELIYAMRGPLLRHLVGRLTRLQQRVDEFTLLHGRRLGSQKPIPAEIFDADTLYRCLQAKLPKIFDTIHDEFPISPVDVLLDHVEIFDPGDGTIGLRIKDPKSKEVRATKIYSLQPSPARVAAADGMLDVFTKAFEDDIDSNFVQPMLHNLRLKLRKTGIGFGVIQRTSVLATNRMVARVDPRATAELSVGQETNLIQGLQSIAQIALAAQTGNVLGGIQALNFAAASEKDKSEIFGITSGSAFQVTPIFDPTGQAMRFKFDFVDATLVREPPGTTNPRIPRIERHSVNTEVQLANLELREVSRFESDAKLGIPTTYRGGLPILKDIPGVRPIPLIGWFIRRKGSNAIVQRSLIFAQTTMSPTIGDILDLFDTSLQRR